MLAPAKLSYCGDRVKRQDHDRYLTALFVPRASREHVFALYAFNAEIARARDVVSEAPLGAIRLQWWREAIAELYERKRPRAHPVVEALGAAVKDRSLSHSHFETLIAAREADLEHVTPRTIAEMEDFAERTTAPLVQLVVELLADGDDNTRAAARYAGLAWALTGLLRAIPYHARNRLLYLPEDLLVQHRVDRRNLFELRPSAGLAGAVRVVADRARAHLAALRGGRRAIPKMARPGLLCAVAAGGYLDTLRRADHDVFALPRSLPSLAPRLAWAALRDRF